MTATLDELKQALVETLDRRGVLGQVKAKVRAEIFAALDDEHAPRPSLPRENAVINELIREYLEYNGYHHTLSVLLPESGHPEERQECFDRPFLASELQLQEEPPAGHYRCSTPWCAACARGRGRGRRTTSTGPTPARPRRRRCTAPAPPRAREQLGPSAPLTGLQRGPKATSPRPS
ncbi:unnamed protein product [Prorocentrum cordatum]|uniref:LisH domain-containing protein n=1 Tax=Prorocentrum cordatum TaxID=2364126 RepID=A0ABN9V375_9DINO|nr:unnamed protein product [Polarella glacialis]